MALKEGIRLERYKTEYRSIGASYRETSMVLLELSINVVKVYSLNSSTINLPLFFKTGVLYHSRAVL